MRLFIARIATAFIGVSLATLFAQQPNTPVTAIPRLVRITGSFHAANGLPVGATESATLSIYKDEQGGTPLWQETQNVTVDAEGHYTATLGATQRDGVPVDLFSSTEPRWLGVQFNRPGEAEQPRVQLVSVPYALRASDAERLGGKPASAYLLDPNAVASGDASAAATLPNPKSLKPRTISGTVNYLPYFTDNSNDLGNSVVYQSGSNIGIGTTGPVRKLDLRDPSSLFQLRFSTGSNEGDLGADPNGFFRLAGTIGGAFGTLSQGTFTENMRLSGGNVGIGTTTPAYPLSIGGTYHTLGNAIAIPNNASYAGFDSAGDPRSFLWMDNSNPDILHVRNYQRGVGGRISFESQAAGAPSLTILNNGNVGIGTTAPGSKLDVAGDINLSGSLRVHGTPLLQVPTGGDNLAVGEGALFMNTSGVQNTAIGSGALSAETDGEGNTALGSFALFSNTTGGGNIAIGAQAAINVSGGNSFNIHIGTVGAPGDEETIRVGGNPSLGDEVAQTRFFVAGVAGATVSGVPVLINTSTGQLGVASSSRRYKEDIQDMGDASSGLMQLRPITFRYKKPFDDGSKPIQYGLIAEEVAEVYPDLVAHGADGQIETVKYQVLDSMLLNEVQKQQKEISALKDQNQSLQDRLTRLEAAMEKITGGGGAQ